MTQTLPFAPEDHGFARLRGDPVAPGVAAYELRNHAAVTRDGAYVTIRSGFANTLATEARIEETVGRGGIAMPPGLDAAGLVDSYGETLFGGWIKDAESARHVLGALRLGPTGRYGRPQALRLADGTVACDLLAD